MAAIRRVAARVRAVARTGQSGMVTVEAAVALCGFVVVLAVVLAGIGAVFDQISCTDAAREAARLAARGDPDGAGRAARQIAPGGARVAVRLDAATVAVEVAVDPAGGLLPGVHLVARAYAVPEPAAVAETPGSRS